MLATLWLSFHVVPALALQGVEFLKALDLLILTIMRHGAASLQSFSIQSDTLIDSPVCGDRPTRVHDASNVAYSRARRIRVESFTIMG